LNFGNWIDINIPVVFNPLSPPNLAANTVINFPKSYRLKLINTTNNCTYESDPVTVTGVQPPVGVTINPSSPSPVLAGTTVTFSTVQGYSSYTWSGAASGTSYQSNPVTFTTPGTYTINLQVCSATGCCVTQTLNFVVNNNCTNPPQFAPQAVTSCSDILLTHLIGSGTGALTYSAVSYSDVGLTTTDGYVNVAAGTAVPVSGTITVAGNLIAAGATSYVKFIVSDVNGCTNQYVVTYTRCSITEFDVNSVVASNQSCASNQWKFKYTIDYKSPCTSAFTNLFAEVILDDGYGETLLSSELITPPSLSIPSFQCRASGLSFSPLNFSIVDLGIFGGQTVTIKVKTYLGTNNTGTLIDTTNLYTSITLPASC
jgi:hypothetical protein